MWNVLNSIKIFGIDIDWPMETALFWLLVAQVGLVIFMVIVFAILILRVRKGSTTTQVIVQNDEKRKLVGITLDTSLVQREFLVGEEFSCEGLLVTAHYNQDPYSEVLHEIDVLTPEKLQELMQDNKTLEDLEGCVVCVPKLDEEGKPTVTVAYEGKTAVYAVSVVTERAAAPIVPVVAVAPAEEPKERMLERISLDTAVVQREFTVGEEFSCDGLLVTAHYNQDPYSEILREITVLTPEKLQELIQDNKKIEDIEGCVVYVPKLDEEGKPTVTVAYKGKTAVYAVSVVAERAPEPVVPAEEPKERTLERISLDTAVVQREFTVGDVFNCDGLIVTAHYSADPLTEQVFEYTVYAPDLSVEGKPTVTVMFGDKTAVYAISVNPAEAPAPVRELVGIAVDAAMARREFTVGDEFNCDGLFVTAYYSEPPYNEVVTDFTVEAPDLSVEGKPTVTVRYGEKTTGYRITVSPAAVVIEEAPEVIRIKHDPIVIEEESFEGGKLRYNRSFTARLIQSDDEVKHWYTELKNELLSYKKVKARMSWKRESFRFGRETVVRLAYRGKTLCVYFPLDPKEYEESKYKVEPIDENNVSYEDTPCLYRIKNAKRVRYAMELIAVVMERLGAKKDENHVSEDYYVPYEGIVELINKGLIKRNIKTKEDEAFFRQNNGEVTEEIAPADVEIAPGVIVTSKVLGEEKRHTIPVPENVPAEKPAEEPVEEPAPVEEVIEAPVEEPAPVEEVAETPVEESAPAEEVVEEPAEEAAPVEEVVEEPVEEPAPVEEVVETPAEEAAPVEEVVEEPVEEPAPVEEVVETPVEEAAPVEKVVETPVEEPAPAEEVVEEPAEEPAPVEEAVEAPVEEPAPAEEVVSDNAASTVVRTSLSDRRRKNRHKRR